MLLTSPSDRPFEILRAVAECLRSLSENCVEDYLTAEKLVPSPVGGCRVWRWWLSTPVVDPMVTCFEVVTVLDIDLVVPPGYHPMLHRGVALLDQEGRWVVAVADHRSETDAELAEHAKVLLDEVLAGGN